MARLPSAVRRALAEAAERARASPRRGGRAPPQRRARATRRSSGRWSWPNPQRRLQAILDYSPAAISLKDTSGRYIVANRRVREPRRTSRAGVVRETATPTFLRRAWRRSIARTTPRCCERQHGLEFEETFLRAGGDRHLPRHQVSAARRRRPSLRGVLDCHRRHRAQEDRRCAADRAARGGAREPGEERVPVEHEPRSADAAQRDPRASRSCSSSTICPTIGRRASRRSCAAASTC